MTAEAMGPIPQNWLQVPEVSKLLGIPATVIFNRIYNDRLACHRVNRRVYVNVEDARQMTSDYVPRNNTAAVPQLTISGRINRAHLPRQITEAQLHKALGADEARAVLERVFAAEVKPVPVGALEALRALCLGQETTGSALGQRSVPALRRWLQVDQAGAQRLAKWCDQVIENKGVV